VKEFVIIIILYRINRYALIFKTESKEEITKLKQEARKEICSVQPEYMECTVEDFYPPELDFPIRPPWNIGISRTELERNENRYFNVGSHILK